MLGIGLQFLWLAYAQNWWRKYKTDLQAQHDYVETCSSQDGNMHSWVKNMRSLEPIGIQEPPWVLLETSFLPQERPHSQEPLDVSL